MAKANLKAAQPAEGVDVAAYTDAAGARQQAVVVGGDSAAGPVPADERGLHVGGSALDEALVDLGIIAGALGLARDPAGRLRVTTETAITFAASQNIANITGYLGSLGNNVGPMPTVAAQSVALSQMNMEARTLRASIVVS